jgi:hypothetical protein
VEYIDLTQYRDKCRASVDTVMNLRDTEYNGDSLTNWKNVSLPKESAASS